MTDDIEQGGENPNDLQSRFQATQESHARASHELRLANDVRSLQAGTPQTINSPGDLAKAAQLQTELTTSGAKTFETEVIARLATNVAEKQREMLRAKRDVLQDSSRRFFEKGVSEAPDLQIAIYYINFMSMRQEGKTPPKYSAFDDINPGKLGKDRPDAYKQVHATTRAEVITGYLRRITESDDPNDWVEQIQGAFDRTNNATRHSDLLPLVERVAKGNSNPPTLLDMNDNSIFEKLLNTARNNPEEFKRIKDEQDRYVQEEGLRHDHFDTRVEICEIDKALAKA